MAKAPSFQFYPADWIKDPKLQMCSFQTKGIWIDLLCRMWESETRGIIEGSKTDFCRLIGCTRHEFVKFLQENRAKKFADIEENGTKLVIKNRRMIKDQKIRNAWKEQKRAQRQQEDVRSVVQDMSSQCPPVSSSSSSFKKKEREREKRKTSHAAENSQTLKPFVRIEIERYLKDPRCNESNFFKQRASPVDRKILNKAIQLVRNKDFDWDSINTYVASLGKE